MTSRLRLLTGGESHGPGLTAILEGLPAGLEVDRAAVDAWLARRQHGFGRGGRQRIEHDRVEISGGLRGGRTLGSPLVLQVANRDHASWAAAMDPWQVDEAAVAARAVTIPRPGHADFAGGAGADQLADMRNVLERASARETAARVAVGAVCAQLLARFRVSSRAAVLQLGRHVVLAGAPGWDDLAAVRTDSPLVTPRPDAEDELVAAVRSAREAGETLGGVVGAVVRGLPPGLGSHVHWDRKLDGRLAQAVMSIPSVKAVAVGAGVEAAAGFGSEVHDAIELGPNGLRRTSNRAGGIEGGVTNGEDLVVRAWFKPIATLRRGLASVDLSTGEPASTAWERSDVAAVAAAPVIVEAVVAFVVADALLAKLGGDAMSDVERAWRGYADRLAPWWRETGGEGG